jgi:hypothetical protein
MEPASSFLDKCGPGTRAAILPLRVPGPILLPVYEIRQANIDITKC